MRKPILVLIFIFLLFTSCSSPPPTIEYGIFTDEDLIGSVKQDTSCFHGPDPRFGMAAELDQNLQILIFGASIEGKYAVIVNPSYTSKMCWVEIEKIDIESADLRKAFQMVSIIHPEIADELIVNFRVGRGKMFCQYGNILAYSIQVFARIVVS